jgi:mxaK protein
MTLAAQPPGLVPPDPISRSVASAAPRIGAALRAARGALLWLVLGASALAFAAAGTLLLLERHSNELIKELRAGKDVAVDPATAASALIEARASFLLARDRIEEAQPLLDQASLRAEPAVEARMLYNAANARLRAAVKAIEQGKFDKAIPLVALAKSEYRDVLRREPGNWDAKYNLDVAMRLVRDLPRAEGEDGGDKQKEPAKLWTDLPGVPKGLP